MTKKKKIIRMLEVEAVGHMTAEYPVDDRASEATIHDLFISAPPSATVGEIRSAIGIHEDSEDHISSHAYCQIDINGQTVHCGPLYAVSMLALLSFSGETYEEKAGVKVEDWSLKVASGDKVTLSMRTEDDQPLPGFRFGCRMTVVSKDAPKSFMDTLLSNVNYDTWRDGLEDRPGPIDAFTAGAKTMAEHIMGRYDKGYSECSIRESAEYKLGLQAFADDKPVTDGLVLSKEGCLGFTCGWFDARREASSDHDAQLKLIVIEDVLKAKDISGLKIQIEDLISNR